MELAPGRCALLLAVLGAASAVVGGSLLVVNAAVVEYTVQYAGRGATVTSGNCALPPSANTTVRTCLLGRASRSALHTHERTVHV